MIAVNAFYHGCPIGFAVTWVLDSDVRENSPDAKPSLGIPHRHLAPERSIFTAPLLRVSYGTTEAFYINECWDRCASENQLSLSCNRTTSPMIISVGAAGFCFATKSAMVLREPISTF